MEGGKQASAEPAEETGGGDLPAPAETPGEARRNLKRKPEPGWIRGAATLLGWVCLLVLCVELMPPVQSGPLELLPRCTTCGFDPAAEAAAQDRAEAWSRLGLQLGAGSGLLLCLGFLLRTAAPPGASRWPAWTLLGATLLLVPSCLLEEPIVRNLGTMPGPMCRHQLTREALGPLPASI